MNNRGINHEYALIQIREAVIADITDIMTELKKINRNAKFVLFEPRGATVNNCDYDHFAYNYAELDRLPETHDFRDGRFHYHAITEIFMTGSHEFIFSSRVKNKDMWASSFNTGELSTETLIQILIKMEEKKS